MLLLDSGWHLGALAVSLSGQNKSSVHLTALFAVTAQDLSDF